MAWRPKDLTVAMNVRDGSPHMKPWAACLAAQSVQGFRVLVVDDGSGDDSVELLKASGLPRLRVLSKEPRGLQAARKELFAAVKTPLVLVVDADIRLEHDAVERFLAALEPESVAAATCRTRDRSGTRASRGHNAVRQWLYGRRVDGNGDATWVDGSPTIWTMNVLDALGGSSDASISEDLDLSFRARRAGHRLRLIDAALATHPDPPTWGELWRREAHTGRREGAMAARGDEGILAGSRLLRLSPLAGPFYVPIGVLSLGLLLVLRAPRWWGWCAFQVMLVAYSVGFVQGYRMARKAS